MALQGHVTWPTIFVSDKELFPYQSGANGRYVIQLFWSKAVCRSCFSAPLQPKHIDHAQGKQGENGLVNACGNIFGTAYQKQDFYCRQACYNAHSRDKQTKMMMCFHLAMDGIMFADKEHSLQYCQ